ncbi:MAG TPA: CPBP family intramembrane glutamic endopeptidase [Planctomycetota bacterium]|nr:CPBP family intramembrane glutamic endopeptidase [Planctomycetota bacterium]
MPVAVAGAGAAAALALVPLRGLPRAGEIAIGSRPLGVSLFHAGLGLLSISLLWFGTAAPQALQAIEPFRSDPALLEAAGALALVAAVAPLLAFVGSAGAPEGALSRGRATAQALGRFALALVPVLLLDAAMIVIARNLDLGGPVTPQSQLVEFSEASGARRAWLAIGAVVAHPIAEEAIFRGTIQPSLARLVGPLGARTATAVLFGALHAPIAILPMIVFGYFVGRVRDASGRLLPCVAIHAVNNAVALATFEIPVLRDLYAS